MLDPQRKSAWCQCGLLGLLQHPSLMGCTGCFTQQGKLSLISPAYRRSSMAKNDSDELMSVGINIGKDVFHFVGFDRVSASVQGFLHSAQRYHLHSFSTRPIWRRRAICQTAAAIAATNTASIEIIDTNAAPKSGSSAAGDAIALKYAE